MLFYAIGLLAFAVCQVADASVLKSRDHVQSQVSPELDHAKYNVAPTNKTRPAVVNININRFSGLNQGSLIINGLATVTWDSKTEELKWDPKTRTGITKISLPKKEKMWKPPVGIWNSKQSENRNLAKSKSLQLMIDYKGYISYQVPFTSETSCPTNTGLYPFDDQVCALLIASSSFDFALQFRNISIMSVGANTGNEEWTLTSYNSTPFVLKTKDVGDLTMQKVVVELYFKRQSMTHVTLIIIPFLLVALVAAVLFIIRDPNERFTPSMMIIVAMSLFVMIVVENEPKSVKLSIMDIFLMVQMALLVALTCVNIIGANFCRRFGKSEDAKDEDETDTLTRPSRSSDYRVRGGGWSRIYDVICVLVYVIATIANVIICLFVLRLMASGKKKG